MNDIIFLSTSVENDLETHEPGTVIWLNFKSKDGASSMINLNNLALERGGIVGKAMRGAIKDYLMDLD